MQPILTKNFRSDGKPVTLKEYADAGGYQSLPKALLQLGPNDVIDLVKDSGLLGRGGAGFPTGTKWSLVPRGASSPRPKYFVVNADEMEPGAFKDRFLLENDPHQLIEGTILGAYAIESEIAYIFLRADYVKAAAIIKNALSEAKSVGFLGKGILGSSFSLDIHLHVSAGRYMCGEETGLINSLEGRRAIPRSKPPFPVVSGLWGKPTVIQNVETVCNVPHIVNHGSDWFRKVSLTGEGGSKIYGVSGRVMKPGAWELPLGTPLRTILEDCAGGMKSGYRFRAVIPGGASTEFLTDEHFDVPMDFGSVQKVGSRLGTGTLIVLDDKTCPVAFLGNIEAFFARESCGWCTPCREGLPWVRKLLSAIEEGSGTMEDIKILESHTTLLGPGHTFCALAPGAMAPLKSGLKIFRKDFEEHVVLKRCPWHVPPQDKPMQAPTDGVRL